MQTRILINKSHIITRKDFSCGSHDVWILFKWATEVINSECVFAGTYTCFNLYIITPVVNSSKQWSDNRWMIYQLHYKSLFWQQKFTPKYRHTRYNKNIRIRKLILLFALSWIPCLLSYVSPSSWGHTPGYHTPPYRRCIYPYTTHQGRSLGQSWTVQLLFRFLSWPPDQLPKKRTSGLLHE